MTINKGAEAPEATFRLGEAPLYTKAEVDRAIVGAIDEMQTEIETLRNTLVRLAVFIGGNPCWCRYAKTGEHTEACRATLKLKLWPRVVRGQPHQSDYLPWKDNPVESQETK